jgi:hypothetical protein
MSERDVQAFKTSEHPVANNRETEQMVVSFLKPIPLISPVIRSEPAKKSEKMNGGVTVRCSAPALLSSSSRLHQHWGTSTYGQLNLQKEPDIQTK